MSDYDKIQLVINKLNNIEGDIVSYTNNANLFSDKYSLEDVLPECTAIKAALLLELEKLGGIWPVPLD